MSDRIETLEDLLAVYPNKPVIQSIEKETSVVNEEYRRLIEASPFFAISSIGEEGMDCSPRGDGPGSVQILDDRTVAFADRRGNNRLDTLRNIVADPRVALLFFIPNWNEALRINGKAHISVNADLRERFSVKGNSPATVVVVEIDTMYFQCARAIKRAGLWSPETWPDRTGIPTAGQLVKSVLSDFDAAEYDGALQERQNKTLY